jgi:hypothetical protein
MAIMAFNIAAGFVTPRTSVLSATNSGAPQAQSAPLRGTGPGYGCLTSRISSSISQNAAEFHRLEFERLGRRIDAENQFQDMLVNLKQQIEWNAAARTRSAATSASVEVYSKAS